MYCKQTQSSYLVLISVMFQFLLFVANLIVLYVLRTNKTVLTCILASSLHFYRNLPELSFQYLCCVHHGTVTTWLSAQRNCIFPKERVFVCDSPLRHQAGQTALFPGGERCYSWYTQQSSEIHCRFTVRMTVCL